MAKDYLSEKEYKAMEYALLYAKKTGIDKALEEVRRDLQFSKSATQNDCSLNETGGITLASDELSLVVELLAMLAVPASTASQNDDDFRYLWVSPVARQRLLPLLSPDSNDSPDMQYLKQELLAKCSLRAADLPQVSQPTWLALQSRLVEVLKSSSFVSFCE